MAVDGPKSSSRPALLFGLCMLVVLVASSICFIALAPEADPLTASDQGPGTWRTRVIVGVIPVALLISVAFLIRRLWDAVPPPLLLWPLAYHATFWTEHGETDFLRIAVVDFVRILSGISSGFFSALLWLMLQDALGLRIPESAPTIVFSVLGLALVAAGVLQYLRLRPRDLGKAAEDGR